MCDVVYPPIGFQDRGARVLQRERRRSRHQTDLGGCGGKTAAFTVSSHHQTFWLLLHSHHVSADSSNSHTGSSSCSRPPAHWITGHFQRICSVLVSAASHIQIRNQMLANCLLPKLLLYLKSLDAGGESSCHNPSTTDIWYYQTDRLC